MRVKLSFCLFGLRLRALDGRLGPLDCRFGRPQPLLRLAPAARIEKRRRRGRDRGDHIIGADLVTDLKSDADRRPDSGAATT